MMEEKELLEQFELLMSTLEESLREDVSPRQQEVIRKRFGFDNGLVKSLETTGANLHITRERVRQIEAKGLRLLCEGVDLTDFKHLLKYTPYLQLLRAILQYEEG